MLLKVILFAIANSLFFTVTFSAPSLAQPAYYLDKVSATPDLTQTDPRSNFGGGGKNYCAPVAVSNSFVWLSEHGYPKLLPASWATLSKFPEKEQLLYKQIALAKTLGSHEYMDTQAEEGTFVDNVLLGIKKYVLDKGYSIRRLEYQGFRSSLHEFDTGSRRPRLAWLKQGLLGNSGVWLHIGWYRFKSESRTYVRTGGHWVTLVGYGVDEKNQTANNILIIHNPASKSGASFHNDFCRLESIDGVLVNRTPLLGFPRPALGFYKIVSGLPPFTECDTAILEGGVVLELN